MAANSGRQATRAWRGVNNNIPDKAGVEKFGNAIEGGFAAREGIGGGGVDKEGGATDIRTAGKTRCGTSGEVEAEDLVDPVEPAIGFEGGGAADDEAFLGAGGGDVEEAFEFVGFFAAVAEAGQGIGSGIAVVGVAFAEAVGAARGGADGVEEEEVW